MSGKKGKAASTDENAVTRQMVAINYTKMCKSIGIPSNSSILENLKGKAEEDGEMDKLILEGEIGTFGSGGVRALVSALLGSGPNINTGAYIHLKIIRIWKQDVGDEGVIAIASLLQASSPTGFNLSFLELLDCNVGDTGCKALGEALQKQKQPGLMTLNLNCNPHISNKGVSVLCDGLFLNTALKQLHLDYCGVGVEGAVKLAQLLSMPRSVIDTLSLRGNELGNQGLFDLSLGLARSHTLTTLNISDNGIRNDHAALEAFRTALQRAKMLANVDLTYNHIEADGASVLLPAFTEENNHKIKNFFVDATLPAALFAQLNRATGIGDGKTKRGKKKKGGKKK